MAGRYAARGGRLAYLPAMVDQDVGEAEPVRPGDEPHEIAFDLVRIRLRCEAQPLAHPSDVGVDGDPGIRVRPVAVWIRVALDDVRGLSGHAGQRDQLGHGLRYPRSVGLEDPLAGAPNGLCLLVEASRGMDVRPAL